MAPTLWNGLLVVLAFFRESSLPHFMSLMVSNTNGVDNKITRGELLCILRIIERLLVTVKFVKHMITPVCFFLFPPDIHPSRERTDPRARFWSFLSWDLDMLDCLRPTILAMSWLSTKRSSLISPRRRTPMHCYYSRDFWLQIPLETRHQQNIRW